MQQCALIGENPDDMRFCEAVARQAGLAFRSIKAIKDLQAFLKANQDAILFWDMDRAASLKDSDPLLYKEVAKALTTFDRSRIFALTSNSLNKIPHLLYSMVFGHHILRTADPTAVEIVGHIVGALLHPTRTSIRAFLPESTKIEEITLLGASQRTAAANAVNNVLLRRRVPPRLAGLAAQAADEMMMNALFDAPAAGAKKPPTRVSRGRKPEPVPESEVFLQIGSCPRYIAIAVTDQYGELRVDTVFSQARKAYDRQAYQTKHGPGAGLGIYEMIQTGLSLFFIVKPGSATTAILLFPVVHNFKKFQTSFRLLGFLSDENRLP